MHFCVQAANVAAESARKAAEAAAKTATDSASSLANLEALKDVGSQYSGIYCKDTELVNTTVKVSLRADTHIYKTHIHM